MKHQEYQSQLSTYIDGELSSSEAVALKAHLEGCSACSMSLAELQSIRQEIRSAAEVRLPESFAASVLRTIRLQTSQSESWQGAEQLAWRIVFALSIIVVTVVGLSSLNKSDHMIIMDRYLSGSQQDSAVQRVFLKPDEISKDDVLLAAVTR